MQLRKHRFETIAICALKYVFSNSHSQVIITKLKVKAERRTFTLEVGRFEVRDGIVSKSFGIETARIAGDEVLCLEPRRQPLQVTVAVERV